VCVEVPWLPVDHEIVIPNLSALLGLVYAQGPIGDLLRRGAVKIKGGKRG
jgi:hypothetical protein